MKPDKFALTAELHRTHSLLHGNALQHQIGISTTANEMTVVIMIAIVLVVVGIAAALIKAL